MFYSWRPPFDETSDQLVELVDRLVLTVVQPSSLNSIASYVQAAQAASTQQNVATAQNVNSPGSVTYVSSTDS